MLNFEQYQAIFNFSPNPYLILSPHNQDFIIADLNEALARCINIPKESLAGQNFFQTLSKHRLDYAQEIQDLREKLKQILISGKSVEYSEVYFASGYYHIKYAPVLNYKKSVKFIILSFSKKGPSTSNDKDNQFLNRLLQKLDQYRGIFTHNPYGIGSFDLDGNFLTANNSLAILTECEPDELYNNTFDRFIAPEDLDKVHYHFEKAASGENQIYLCSAITAKGNKRVISITNIPIMVKDEVIGVYGIIVDVTEKHNAQIQLMELNKELMKKADELLALNTEMEHFAYIASHDMKEPLRMIKAFMELLQRKYGDELDEDANTYIRYAINGSERMQQLIKDLLNYSRTGKEDAQKVTVHLKAVLDEALHNLTRQLEENDATVVVENELPHLKIYRSEMVRLFQNLVSNAVKFRKNNEAPVVRIGAREEDFQWVINVSDNGFGILEENYEKIFKIFSRIHTREEHSGTGIGLAICKKIVQHHNGDIWLESEKGAGSTFYFSIAKE